MRARDAAPYLLRLVIFDCDGVLVDSEGPSNRAVAEEVSELGWPMDKAESMRRFVGRSGPAPSVSVALGLDNGLAFDVVAPTLAHQLTVELFSAFRHVGPHRVAVQD